VTGDTRQDLRQAEATQKYAWAINNEQINVANRHLSLEADVSRTFFDGPPYRPPPAPEKVAV
jgi:hypothetical protein